MLVLIKASSEKYFKIFNTCLGGLQTARMLNLSYNLKNCDGFEDFLEPVPIIFFTDIIYVYNGRHMQYSAIIIILSAAPLYLNLVIQTFSVFWFSLTCKYSMVVWFSALLWQRARMKRASRSMQCK